MSLRSYIIMLGPPGAGKGTQAKVLADTLHLPHISSGDLFRENLKNETPLGKQAQAYMNKGELVPDDLTIAMVADRLGREDCDLGAVLDGFPRTPAQAQALSALLAELGGKVKIVPYIAVPAEVLIERLGGRWMSQSGRVYHEKNNPPKVKWVDDVDGTPLYQREDDKPETVRRRIEVYHQQTSPLIAFYKAENLLVEIDGTREIDLVTGDLIKAVQEAM